MKSFISHLLIIVLSLTHLSHAQNRSKTFAALPEYAPNQIIFKIKDEATNSAGRNRPLTPEMILERVNINEFNKIKKLLPETFSSVLRSKVEQKELALYQTYLVELKENPDTNLLDKVEEIDNLSEIDYAEPNYIVNISDFVPVSREYQNSEIGDRFKTSESSGAMAIAPNDPLFTSQTNITATHIDDVWETTTGDGSKIIAIIDTGVDLDHPDLVDNIWTNTTEINGLPGVDDDGNGYIDDTHGWDFINEDGQPYDDNSHGTHVAGIAAAVGNNGIGIAGACWDAQIMSIKAMQSSGRGDVATLAESIEYAYLNGADVINFSLGTYGESITLKRALEDAYISSILVASAGNDAIKIGPCRGCYPTYPAAYTFVLGVEDRPVPDGYSNYDQDGPLFSEYHNLLNYEMASPGSGIMSTIPGGGYRSYTGTSMSAPLLAGSLLLYDELKPDDSKEIIFGNLIKTSGTYFDLEAAVNVVPVPDLRVLSAELIDTLNADYVDGQADVGEVLEIKPLIKNYWGPTDEVYAAIVFDEFEDESKATIIDGEVLLGSVDAYGTISRNEYPLKIQIASDVKNNVDIVFKLQTWSGPDKDYFNEIEYVINVKNAIKFFGLITTDITLSADKKYLVSDQLVIAGDAVLTIKPGAVLEVSDNVDLIFQENAQLIAIGKPDSIIHIKPEGTITGNLNLLGGQYQCEYMELDRVTSISAIQNDSYFRNCIFRQCGTLFSTEIRNCNFYDGSKFSVRSSYDINHNNHTNNNLTNSTPLFINGAAFPNTDTIGNVFNNHPYSLQLFDNNIRQSPFIYWGTADSLTARKAIQDFFVGYQNGVLDITGYLKKPDSLAHGIVWKVLVNGLDAQDEYDIMDPIGVGTHRFDVYFNRPMDTLFVPQVSMGVREPYNQSLFQEGGDWSDDSLVYTIYHSLGLQDSDGINRIRVQGAKDTDHFEIPLEATRFNVLVQAAGSASAGFVATPGLGKIELDWDAPDGILTDILGYNVYRQEPAEVEGELTEAVQVNEILITDPAFTDFDVVQNNRYYYKYTVVRTNFTETDSSKVVSAIPLTASLGDANGDFAVNVMDVIQEVDFILGENPTPFIFEAADVNLDLEINVLDVVGTVNLVLNPGGRFINDQKNDLVEADVYWDDGTLYLNTPVDISGIQLVFEPSAKLNLAENLDQFELAQYEQDGKKVFMIYSFNNRGLRAGRHALFRGEIADLTGGVSASAQGNRVDLKYLGEKVNTITAVAPIDQFELVNIYPNPNDGQFYVRYTLPEQVDITALSIFDTSGRIIYLNEHLPVTPGFHDIPISRLEESQGFYVVQINMMRNGYLLHKQAHRLIIK